MLCGCTVHSIYHTKPKSVASVHLARALNIALSWPAPADVDALKGAVLVRDGPPVRHPELAIARAILHTNPRLTQAAALLFAGATARRGARERLPPEFLGATLLQESAYDPHALSAAGAIGIAQFMPETAAGVGVDPYDPFASIDAAGALLGGYAAAYRDRYADRLCDGAGRVQCRAARGRAVSRRSAVRGDPRVRRPDLRPVGAHRLLRAPPRRRSASEAQPGWRGKNSPK